MGQGKIQYFLGSNSVHGFASLYGDFCKPETGTFLWVIKGGPGCGKSSFMKKIGSAAEADRLAVHYVWCSGDPDSLDAVYVPAWKTGYVDGTEPHVMEVPYPAASGLYLDLGQFYDRASLQPRLEKIMHLIAQNRKIYTEAYDLLAGAAKLEKLQEHNGGFEPFRLSSEKSSGNITRRFYRALTCLGPISFPLCEQAPEMLPTAGAAEDAAREAAAAGLDVVCAQHPIFPELTEAVFVPNTGDFFKADLDRLEEALLPLERKVSEKLAAAKAIHDELEAVFNPHVDFDGVYALAARHIASLKK